MNKRQRKKFLKYYRHSVFGYTQADEIARRILQSHEAKKQVKVPNDHT